LALKIVLHVRIARAGPRLESSTASGGLDVVLSDAGVDHSREVAGAVKARWRRSVLAEDAVECHGNQRTSASDHQIVRHGWAGLFEAFEQPQGSVPTWHIC
jgi:hypothetical protein